MWKACCLLIIVACTSALSHAAIFGVDDRISVRHGRGSIYSPIGLLARQRPQGDYKVGTAFLVSDCLVVSAQHVFGETGKLPVGMPLKFLVGEGSLAGGFEKATTARVIASGGYNLEIGLYSRDWLVAKLDQCLGAEFGTVGFNDRFQLDAKNTPIMLAGYPQAVPSLKVDPQCRIADVDRGLWLHDCASEQGQSGGPLFRKIVVNGIPKLEVLAMHVAGYRRNARLEASAYSTEEMRTNAGVPLRSLRFQWKELQIEIPKSAERPKKSG